MEEIIIQNKMAQQIIDENGVEKWYDEKGQLHRDNDLPAMSRDELLCWYQHGKLHRENDKPAVIDREGCQEWWFEDKLHREGDKPAVIDPSTSLAEWYVNGEKIRECHVTKELFQMWKKMNCVESY